MGKKEIKNKPREDTYTEKLEKKLAKAEKRNKQLLTALKTAKQVIKTLHNKANGNMGKHFWDEFQQKPFMKRINKAIKDV